MFIFRSIISCLVNDYCVITTEVATDYEAGVVILVKAVKLRFFLYHNKVHPLNSYKAIKNKSNKTRQHRTQNLHKKYTV